MIVRREPFVALLLVLTTLVWGSAFTAIKKVVEVLHPIDLAFVRFALAGLLFVALLAERRRRGHALPALTPREWAVVALLGFFGVVGYHVALNGGEALLSATASEDVAAILSGFLISLNPLFTLFLAPAFLPERIGGRRAAGALVALVGASILILWGRGTLIGADALWGAVLVLVAPFSWALYTLLMKRLVRGYDPLDLTAYSMIAGTLLLLPFVSGRLWTDLGRLDAPLWGWLLVLAIGATFLGYLAWNYALSHWEAGRVSVFVYLVPLFGLTVATLQARERVTPQILVGGALVLFGVWWANRSATRAPGRPGATTPGAGAPPTRAP